MNCFHEFTTYLLITFCLHCLYPKAKTEQLSNETASLEDEEAGLVHDCVRELQATSLRIGRLHDELTTRSDIIATQNEKISSLMAKIAALEKNAVKVRSLCLDCICDLLCVTGILPHAGPRAVTLDPYYYTVFMLDAM